jgi:CRISPR-associated protein Cmr6
MVRDEHLKAVQSFLVGTLASANPGLLLDRLLGYPTHKTRSDGKRGDRVTPSFTLHKEEHKKPHLEAVCASVAENAESMNTLLPMWDTIVGAACDSTETFRLATVWRMAMHLSRATAVENASLCLHPVYGFPYLPGTGLKGLARTWAHLYGPGKESEEFKRVFGTQGGTGSVVFLEAWPEQITDATVEIDIVNNHHREYYSRQGATAPGDWESPVPVYFLAVAPGVTFRFAVAKARPTTPASDLVQAEEWLKRGLTELGFGAKTAAGYGYFTEPAAGSPAASAAHATQAEGPLAEFQAEYGPRLEEDPDKNDVGQTWAHIRDQMDEPAMRNQAVDWVLDLLEGNEILDASAQNKPTYRERLLALKQKGE